jgi:hypothetical protein
VHTPKPSEQEKTDGLRHSKWFEYLGKDFYIDVLEIARENLPEGTKLFYNEYGEQHPEKRKAIIQVIENIKKYEQQTGKVLLDGIGLQSHYDLNAITEQQIEDIYSDFSKTGKEIQVTEMDIPPGLDENGHHLSYNSQNMQKYAKIWNKVFSCAEQYGVKAFTGWGINDSLSWHKNVGCTMVSKDGSIKEFAKDLFKGSQQKKEEKNKAENTKRNELKLEDVDSQEYEEQYSGKTISAQDIGREVYEQIKDKDVRNKIKEYIEKDMTEYMEHKKSNIQDEVK